MESGGEGRESDCLLHPLCPPHTHPPLTPVKPGEHAAPTRPSPLSGLVSMLPPPAPHPSLSGLVSMLSYGASHGGINLPQSLDLQVLTGCLAANLVNWLVLVPLVFK